MAGEVAAGYKSFMNTPTPTRTALLPLRKKIVGGGIIVGLIALGLWWNGLGPGLGPGDGGGGDGTSESSSTSTSSNNGDGHTSHDDGDRDSLSPGPGDRLTVLIRGDRYELVREDRNVPVTLEEIVELVREMPGDDDGIRVVITHDPTGVSGAQSDLEQALATAGLTRDEWRSVQQPVE